MRNEGKGNRRNGERRRREGAGCVEEGTAGLAAAGQSEGLPWKFFRHAFHRGPAAAGAQDGNHFERRLKTNFLGSRFPETSFAEKIRASSRRLLHL